MRGFTLVELLMAMSISAILIMALAGIVTATQSAWKHTQGIEDSQAEITASFERMKMMISQAGVYQLNGQAPQVGLAVVTRPWNYIDIPDVLVVWSGGRNGGISQNGVLNRLPRMNELLIYTSDPADPQHFVEIALPDVTTDMDFNSATFASAIRSAIQSNQAEKALLSQRLKTSQYLLSGEPWGPSAANIIFTMTQTPDDTSLSGVTPGTSAWMNLAWPQGTVSASSGLRQVSINYEIQFETAEQTALNEINSATALPFFGSSSRLYAYTP
jgi:prepilin-type N-terminal cleavage/methylation domain-containing protein